MRFEKSVKRMKKKSRNGVSELSLQQQHQQCMCDIRRTLSSREFTPKTRKMLHSSRHSARDTVCKQLSLASEKLLCVFWGERARVSENMYEHDTSSCRKSSQINDSEINILVAILSEEEYFYLLLGNRSFHCLALLFCACFFFRRCPVLTLSSESLLASFFSNSDSVCFSIFSPPNVLLLSVENKKSSSSVCATQCSHSIILIVLLARANPARKHFFKKTYSEESIREVSSEHTTHTKIWQKRIKAIFHLKL